MAGCAEQVARNLRRIVVQSERQARSGAYYIDWSHTIWRADEGQMGGYIVPPNIFMPPDAPPQPGFRVKPKKDGSQTGGKDNADAG